EDRREHLMATNHSRQQYHDVEIGVRRDGTIVALRDRFMVDLGGYIRTHGVVVPELTIALLPGPYRVPHYECEALCVMTNKTPTGTYRGPGRYEGTFVRERLMDRVAAELGLDPAEVRRRNFISAGEMPYEVGGGALGQRTVYDCGDYRSAFDQALAAADYEAVRTEQPRARAQGRYLGVGIGCVLEKAGLGPWELARAAVPGPPGMEPGLYAAHFFEAPKMTYPYGTHVAVVEVDPATGRVALRKYVVTYDVGRAINPMIVDGQILGGLAQGLGGAIFEELVYDDQGQPLTTTFMDYLVPTAMEMPEATIVKILEETPTPLNPLGVKGVGEGGSSGVGAAIANAVADAL